VSDPTDRRFDRARRGADLIVSMIRLHPRLFAVAVSGAALFAICTVASSFAIRYVTDDVILPRFEEGSVERSALFTGIGLIIGIGVLRAVGVVIRRSFAGMTQWRVAQTLTRSVVDRLVRQPAAWHARRADGELVSRAGVDADASVAVLAPIPFATGTVLMVLVSSVWLLVTDVPLGLAAIAVFPLLIGMNVVYQHRVDVHYEAAQRGLGAFGAAVHESFEGVQLVKAYGAESRETTRLAGLAADVRDARIRAVRLRGTFESMLEVVPSLVNVGLVLFGAARVDAGALTVGELSSFVFLFTLLVFPLRLIGWTLSEIPHSLAGWNRIREVLDEPIDPDPREAIGEAAPGVGIELDDVVFTYPGESTPALDGISLRVASGTILAVVGATGAGKTTLVDVVAGLVPVDRGDVRLAPGARAVVFQEPFLFSGTVRENLAVGEPFGDDEQWTALAMAAADEFVRSLPHGLDTVVGERGVSLSGGQRQRVALARALVRRPTVLVLDDTTSALDPGTEATVLANLRTSLGGTTVLLVASRPSTIGLADQVAHLDGGRLVAAGTHEELMGLSPGYRDLVEAFETDRRERPTSRPGSLPATEVGEVAR
jgi:ABC-type multidrug transport system fused ATPase/permease subunit